MNRVVTLVQDSTIMKSLSFICALAIASIARLLALNEIPDEYRTGSFALGCQAYTFHRFTFFEAVEKTAAAGGRVIELFPGQKLSPESDAKVDHNASEEVIVQIKAKLEKHKILAVNYGVVGLPNNE